MIVCIIGVYSTSNVQATTDDIYEDNDIWSDAVTLSSSVSYTAKLLDDDWYNISTEVGQFVEFNIEGYGLVDFRRAKSLGL